MNRALLLLCLLPALAHADGSGATKPPPGYPAFLPWLVGGIPDAKMSNGKTTVLTYPSPDPVVAKDMRALLEKAGWKFEEDVIPGMRGQRFVVRKDSSSAYFTIRPDVSGKKTTMIVTDTSDAK